MPILEAFDEDKFQLVMSQPLMEELHLVWNRPLGGKQINPSIATWTFEQQLQIAGQYGLSWKRFHLIVRSQRFPCTCTSRLLMVKQRLYI